MKLRLLISVLLLIQLASFAQKREASNNQEKEEKGEREGRWKEDKKAVCGKRIAFVVPVIA